MARRRWKMEDIKSVVDGQNPFIQVGYGKSIKREEGDVWTDSHGVTWIKKQGYKTRLNKQADAMREQLREVCSVCNKEIKWGSRFDRMFFNKTGKCQDCVTEVETVLKLTGLWPLYEKKKIFYNKLSLAKEFKSKTEEAIQYLETYNGKIEFFNPGNNTVEVWTDDQRSFRLEEAKTDLKLVSDKIEELSREISDLEREEEETLNELEKSK
jgi:hypothetical protein